MLDQKMLTFIEVVRLKSFTKAADNLCVTQPAVSQQIDRLEEHYGCSLFRHSGRKISLTAQGELVYTYGKLQQANERKLEELLQKENSSLIIGATLSIADYYLPKLLTSYLQSANQSISLIVGNTETLTDSLLEGKIMCAFIEGNFEASLFESSLFCRARFVPVVSSRHPLSRRQCSFDELMQYPLLVREPGSGTRAILENYLFTNSRNLYSFPDVQEIGNFKTIKQLLADSEAVSFMYEKVAAEEVQRGSLAYADCSDFHIDRMMNFIYPKGSFMQSLYERFFQDILSFSASL